MTVDTGRRARWRLGVSILAFDVIDGTGVKRQAAKALSRLPTTGKDHIVLDDELPILASETPNSSLLDLIKQDASLDHYIPDEATQHTLDSALPSENEIIAE